jgi:hypothetical protein
MDTLSPNSRIVNIPIKVDIETCEVLCQILKSYGIGIGIDCHSTFYQIYVLIRREHENVEKFEWKAKADVDEINSSHSHAISLLTTNGIQVDSEDLHYTLESTGPYHRPLILM